MVSENRTPLSTVECSLDSARAVEKIFGVARDMGDELPAFQDFLCFALPLVGLSKSQHIQDLWAAWVNRGVQNPYFVEFGAANGISLSNTYMLEKEFGWSGVVAEPNPRFAAELVENRNCATSTKCVYSVTGETIEFLAPKRALLGRIAHIEPDDRQEREGKRLVAPIEVETISLNDLLLESNAPETIHFMSVDTEGSELHILEAFDFERWDVQTLCVEHSRTEMRQGLASLLESKGFFRVWPNLSRVDDWYVKADCDQASLFL